MAQRAFDQRPVGPRPCDGMPGALAGGMNSILRLLHLGPAADASPSGGLKALEALRAATLNEARQQADQVLAKAKRCQRCRSLLAHVFDCLGSTLFLDDDPHALKGAFQPTDCDQFSEQVLAALIVRTGRPRALPPCANWPDSRTS